MRVKLWGTRGSVPVPGAATARYGGNTSCVQVTLADGTTIVLDAGTGVRPLGQTLDAAAAPIHVLLTHLHIDHIQGMLFFAPLFDGAAEITIWGPPSRGSLERRIGRYLSAPLSPVEVRELPAGPEFRACPAPEWRIGSATVQAQLVAHRGPTLGYRIADGDSVLCYLPDHEPALGGPLPDYEDEWISGLGLARGASLLIHDCQYTDDEYAAHRGWGHSGVGDSLAFAARCGAERTLLFHHDPLHDDEQLDALAEEAATRFGEGGGNGELEMAVEGAELEV
ncbi:MAG TPA: MBL fold metallo-hydrolase [Thermoleophilaceae bacterium]|nr:MBL fold metallo-hydrolase [Thermoleophilaceae bacterium]